MTESEESADGKRGEEIALGDVVSDADGRTNKIVNFDLPDDEGVDVEDESDVDTEETLGGGKASSHAAEDAAASYPPPLPAIPL